MDETAVDLGHGQKLLIPNRHDDVGRDPVAPVGVGGCLLVDRKPLGEPADYPVVGQRQDVHVAELMPECAGPVELSRRATRGAVHRDGVPAGSVESHSKGSQAWHAHGADREILVVGVDLDLHRLRKLVLVLLLKDVHRAPDFGLEVRAEGLVFLLMQLEDDSRSFHGLVIRVAVHQPERVDGGFVVVVVFVAEFELGSGFPGQAEAHQVDPKLGMRAP